MLDNMQVHNIKSVSVYETRKIELKELYLNRNEDSLLKLY